MTASLEEVSGWSDSQPAEDTRVMQRAHMPSRMPADEERACHQNAADHLIGRQCGSPGDLAPG